MCRQKSLESLLCRNSPISVLLCGNASAICALWWCLACCLCQHLVNLWWPVKTCCDLRWPTLPNLDFPVPYCCQQLTVYNLSTCGSLQHPRYYFCASINHAKSETCSIKQIMQSENCSIAALCNHAAPSTLYLWFFSDEQIFTAMPSDHMSDHDQNRCTSCPGLAYGCIHGNSAILNLSLSTAVEPVECSDGFAYWVQRAPSALCSFPFDKVSLLKKQASSSVKSPSLLMPNGSKYPNGGWTWLAWEYASWTTTAGYNMV